MKGCHLAVCLALISVSSVSSIKVDGSTNGLRGHAVSDLEASVSSFTASVETFGEHLRASWAAPKSEPQQLVGQSKSAPKGNATKAAKPTDDMPASRKAMYFRPVSVTLMCVMALTISSLLVYTALSISRNYDELSATFKPSAVTQTLTIASRIANFAPMLCMLFVACRMYILATTEGLGEPPAYVKQCMWGAVAGVAIQFVVVVCLPLFTHHAAVEEADYDMTEGAMAAYLATHSAAKPGQPAPAEAEEPHNLIEVTGEFTDAHPDLSNIEYNEGASGMKPIFYTVQVLSLVLVYGSILGVIIGIMTFPAQTTHLSPSVQCTITLSKLYFIVCISLVVIRMLPESEFNTKCTHAFLAASGATKKAPMFAVLFLASRMRALNLDPPYGMPPFWMQCCFYTITGLVCLESLAAAGVGYYGDMQKAYYGVYIFKIQQNGRRFLHYVEHLSALTSYLLLIPVISGVTLMESVDGHPAPLSTTLRCVIVFQGLYFTVMFLQGLALFAEEARGNEMPILRDTFVAAGVSLGLAPLLSILFVATRMRALQITQQQGAPPGWAQDCMLIAVFATGVQAVCSLVMPIFIGKATEVDADGNPDYDLEPMIGAYAVAIVKYVALLTLHGSVITICISVYVMTPETAHDGGRFLTNRKQFFEMLMITAVIFLIALLLSSAKVVGIAIKMAIESADTALLGVDITIKKCALNAFKGYVQINDLQICQPQDELIYAKNDKGKLVGTPTGHKCDWKYDYIARIHLVLIKINLWRLVTSLGKEFELDNLSLTGVYVNVEKPDTNTKNKNSNVEYILNHIESLGLLPAADEAPKKEEPKPKKEEPKPKKEDAKPKHGANDKDAHGTKVILHKIVLGNMGVSVSIQKVKFLGEISFQPSIGEIGFDDIQRDVFCGYDDLSPGETVACIVRALVVKIFKEVAQELPRKLAGSMGGVVSGLKDALASSWYRITGHHEDHADDDSPTPR